MLKSRFALISIKINFLLLLPVLIFQTTVAQESKSLDQYGLPVFPGVSGFGLCATGGQGGKIIKVTNLNRSGPGSLTEAVRAKGRRIVIFEVGGVIDMEGRTIIINNPELTIAGQTAPSPGITLIKGGIAIRTHNVIIQHIRIRVGEAGNAKKSGWEHDGINTGRNAYNVIIDHCSISWATDENLTASGPRFGGNTLEEWRKSTSHKISFTNCIISEGLNNSTHSKGRHSMGTLVHDNVTEIAIIGNLYAHNHNRNPLFKGGVQGVIANNVVYNPGSNIFSYVLVPNEWGKHPWVDGIMVAVGNYAQFGPNSTKGKSLIVALRPCSVYVEDNIALDMNGNPIRQLRGECITLENIPLWPDGYKAIPSSKVKGHVLKNAGARPWDRDEIDKRIINDVVNKTGKIIDSEQEVGGYPVVEPTRAPFNPEEWDLNTMTRKNGLY